MKTTNRQAKVAQANAAAMRKRMDESPYKEQLNHMLQKGSPLPIVWSVYQEYTNSNCLTDKDRETLDLLLRKDNITDEEWNLLVGTFTDKCLITGFEEKDQYSNDPIKKTLCENGILMTFANMDDQYCYMYKYYPDTADNYGIRFITFSTIIAQAETLKTRAVLAWRVGDDTNNGRQTFYYDGKNQSFHRGVIVTHETLEQLTRWDHYRKQLGL